MKKLYSLVLAAAVTLGANAATPKATVSKAELASENCKITLRQATEKKATSIMKAPAADYEAYTWKALGTGKYTSSVVADTYGCSNEAVDVEVYEAVEKAGVYKAVGVWPDMVDNGELIVDASNPDFITVPKQFTGIKDTVDGDTYIASQTWVLSDEKGYTADAIIGGVPDLLPTLSNGVINFPVKSLVLNWPDAPDDSKYGTDPTAWYVGENAGSLVLPGGEYVEPWTLYGTAVVTGDFYLGLFGVTPAEEGYEIEVYQATTDPTQFTLKNVLKGLFEALEFSSAAPDLEMDATDPENIVFPFTSTKVNGGATDGLYYMCSYSYNSEDPADCPEANRIKFTEGDKVSTIEVPVHGLLLYASTSKKLYYGNSATATFTITRATSGINDVAVDAAQEAPVYYNLQGVRVAEPANGLFIEVRGNKAVKVLK